MKYRPEACGVAGTVIAHMCRDKIQATMDTIKIRTSKDKDKDEDVMPTHRSSTWGRRHSAATNIEHATQVCILMRSHHHLDIDAIDHEVASDGE